MTKKYTRVSSLNGKLSIFAGVIKCGDCGYTMIRKTNGKGYVTYTCKTHQYDKTKCTTHTIGEKVLNESIYKAIMLQIKLATDINTLSEEINKNKNDNKDVQVNKKVLNNLNSEIELNTKILNDIYFDLKKGLVTEDQYRQMQKDVQENLKDTKVLIEKLNLSKKDKPKNNLTPINVYDEFEKAKELTRVMVWELIECIYVNKDKSLKIDFKYADEIRETLNLLELK
ncbi:MAG: zinc ribbon domain-containing protein [Lachnospirales bacterium]